MRPDEGSSPLVVQIAEVQIAVPKGPPALQEVVLEEYDTRNGREQRVRVGGPDGLVYKRKVQRPPPPPRSRRLPDPQPVKVSVRTAQRGAKAAGEDTEAATRPVLAAVPQAEGAVGAASAGGNAAPDAAADAAAPAGLEVSVGAPAQQQTVLEAEQDAASLPEDVIMSQADVAPAAQPELPAASDAQPTQAAVAVQPANAPPAAAAHLQQPIAAPTQQVARSSELTAAASSPAARAAQALMELPNTAMSREEIDNVLAQLPAGAPVAERQATLVALLARSELSFALAFLQRPASDAAAPDASDKDAGVNEAPEAAAARPAADAASIAAKAALDTAVAAALAAAQEDFAAAAATTGGFGAADASTLAALEAAGGAAGSTAAGGAAAGFRGMSTVELAAARAAVQARLDALNKEWEEWDRLAAQRAQLTPQRPAATARAVATSSDGADASGGAAATDVAGSTQGVQQDDVAAGGEAALPTSMAAARSDAHAQLALQVQALCGMTAEVADLLEGADATTAALQAAYDAAAFGQHEHLDSPAVLIRNAIRPLPVPPTPAAERAAREA